MAPPHTASLLSMKDLQVAFPRKGFRKEPFNVIKGVSFDLARGETLGSNDSRSNKGEAFKTCGLPDPNSPTEEGFFMLARALLAVALEDCPLQRSTPPQPARKL
jgi:hypothetical protein